MFGQPMQQNSTTFGSSFNPQAAAFTPSSSFGSSSLPASSPFGFGGGAAAGANTTPFGVTKKFGEPSATIAPSDTTDATPNQGLSTSFGTGFGAPKDSATTQSGWKFGETPVASTVFGKAPTTASFGYGSGSVDDNANAATQDKPPTFMTQFGTTQASNSENNPFGKAGQGAESAPAPAAAVPNFLSNFGSTRTSTTVNNPFGLPAAGQSSSSEETTGLGLGTASNSNSTADSSPFKFGNPFAKPTPAVEKPAASESPAQAQVTPKPLFSGFNFGSSNPAQPEQQAQNASPGAETSQSVSAPKTASCTFFSPTSQSTCKSRV